MLGLLPEGYVILGIVPGPDGPSGPGGNPVYWSGASGTLANVLFFTSWTETLAAFNQYKANNPNWFLWISPVYKASVPE